MNYASELAFAKKLAIKAGGIAKQYSALEISITHKIDYSPVTQADEKINKLVIEEVKKVFPEHSVLGEEESYNYTGPASMCWVCDPIDGTMPFVLGMSCSTFCLALTIEGLPVIGVVYDFAANRLFSAIKGVGAWLNDMPLEISTSKPMRLVDLEWWDSAPNNLAGVREELFKNRYQVPNYTSGAYMGIMVGLRRIAGFIDATDKPWDIAATKVIVEELGINVKNLNGQEQRYDQPIKGAIVAADSVFSELLNIVRDKSSESTWH